MRGGPGDEPTVLSPALGGIRARVDEVLREFLGRERAELSEVDPEGARLVEEVIRLIQAGGKRLRPAFCYWGHRAAGGSDGEPIVRAAASLELLHTFAIIHDDVMDASTARRGVPSAHTQFAEERRQLGLPGSPERFGMAAAVLAGDLATVLADRLFLASGFPPGVLIEAKRRYDGMRVEMAVGQFLDISPVGAGEVRTRRIAALKTGSYTVEGPLQVGAALAGAGLEVMATLSGYGRPLGEAFQVRDDILGVLSEEGEPLGERPSVLLAWAREASDGDQRAALERMGAGSRDREGLREVLVATGAIERGRALVRRLAEEAASALEEPSLEPEAASALRTLAEALADV